MSSFNDGTCPDCGKRFGWTGNMKNKPPCPRCGHTDDPAELAALDEKMERIMHEMFDKEEEEKDGAS